MNGLVETLAVAAMAGALLGLRYRIPAVIIASAAAAVAAIAVALSVRAPFWLVVVAPFAAMTALQCGYLLSLGIGVLIRRRRLAGARARMKAARAEATGRNPLLPQQRS